MFGGTRKEISVTSTWTRFEIAATAASDSLLFAVATSYTRSIYHPTEEDPESMETWDYATLSIDAWGAMVEPGTTATAYAASSTPAAYSVSATGLVSFVSAPGNGLALTWTGDYYDPATPYEIPSPYLETELRGISYAQSQDVLILTHINHPPMWLGRTSDAAWALEPLEILGGPFDDINTATATTITTSAVSGTVTLTASSAIFTTDKLDKLIYLEAKDGATPWEAGKSVTTNAIRCADGKNYKCKAGGTTGTVRPTHDADEASDGGVVWIYQDRNFGWALITAVGSTTATASVKGNLPAACLATGSHKWAFSPWGETEGYPGAVTYHQQRLYLAGSPNKPNTFWASRVGSYKDFSTSNPIADDDALTFSIVSSQMNRITGLISLGGLLATTEGGTWAIGDKEPLTPSTLKADLQGYRGASSLTPMGVGNTILYVEDKAQNLRDLIYEWASNSYNGNNLNALASHMVKGQKIQEWTYQPSESVVWAIRDDGTLLGCTYMRDQEVIGWHRHDTDGTFESVCCVSEGDTDAVYVSVLRGTKRYIERFASRNVLDVRDGWFVDSGLEFNGLNTSATTITFTLAAGVYTATASAALFAAGDVGDQIVLFDEDTRLVYRWNITAFTDSTHVTVVPVRAPLPTHLSTAITEWSWGRKTFSGLSHLEGKTLSILTDGFTCSEDVTVASGAFTLTKPAYHVIAGLGYTQDLETLGANALGESVIDKKRIINGVRFLVDETWSISAGRDESHLMDAKVAVNTYDDPVEMVSGLVEVRIASTWDKQGRVLIRNTNPLPVSILAILPEVTIGGV